MSEKDNGGPAFPRFYQNASGRPVVFGGMTLRDWFAGQAMQALITADVEIAYDRAAECAYFHADEMLEARNK